MAAALAQGHRTLALTDHNTLSWAAVPSFPTRSEVWLYLL